MRGKCKGEKEKRQDVAITAQTPSEGKKKKLETEMENSTTAFLLLFFTVLLSPTLVQAYCPPGCRFVQCLNITSLILYIMPARWTLC